MKKTFSLICTLLLCSVCAYAGHLTPRQALARLTLSPVARSAGQADIHALKTVATLPEVYVFSSGRGFVIASGNDCAPALLGYADIGSFDTVANPSLAWWVRQYSEQIADAQQRKLNLRQAPDVPVRTPIAPLCPIIWNQGGPYNDSCPLYHDRRCVTGCVATAMSILMRYHNWPAQGVGVHSYKWNDTTLTFDYGATRFQWENMTEHYDRNSTEEQKAAVAQLMYAAGVSVNMYFHPGESSAEIGDIEPALRNHFNYSRSMWTPARNYYDLEEWNTLIYNELAAGRPVIYFGDGSDGGHEFICDGYSHDGLFHFNWGWGGISNGYFSLIDLDPPALGIGGGDGGFNFQQHVILGIRPPQDGDTPHYLMQAPNGFVAEKMNYAASDTLSFKGRYFNRSSIELPDSAAYGLKVEPLDGAEAFFVVSKSLAGLKSNHAEMGMNVKLPELAEGNYRISPVYKADSAWQRLPTPVNSNSSYVAVVSPDSILLTDPGVPHLSGGTITMITPLVYHHNFRCSLLLENSGDGAFSGMIRPQLLTVDSLQVVANGAELIVDVPATDTITAHFNGGLTLNSHYSKAEPKPGMYVLRFINSGSHQQIGDTLHVNLYEPSDTLAYTVGDFHIDGGPTVYNPSDVKFSGTVDCSSGYFTLPLQIVLYRKEGEREEQLRMFKTNNVYIVGGQQGEATASVDLSELEEGAYRARAFVDHKPATDFMDFTVRTTTGVNHLTTVESESPLYDLNGMQILKPVSGNIYIAQGHLFIYP